MDLKSCYIYFKERHTVVLPITFLFLLQYFGTYKYPIMYVSLSNKPIKLIALCLALQILVADM